MLIAIFIGFSIAVVSILPGHRINDHISHTIVANSLKFAYICLIAAQFRMTEAFARMDRKTVSPPTDLEPRNSN
jgi:hypothetical protein